MPDLFGRKQTTQSTNLASDFTTTSLSYTDMTGYSLTLPTRSRGKAHITMSSVLKNSSALSAIYLAIHDGTTEISTAVLHGLVADKWLATALSHAMDLDGSIIKGRGKVSTSTGTYSSGNKQKMTILEVS